MRNKGFTLIETIIYIAIFSILVTGLVAFSDNIRSSRIRNQTVFEINDQNSRVVNVITHALRNAVSVTNPTIGAVSSSLTVTTFVPATDPTTFNLNNGILYITEGSGSPTALTNDKITISDLTFYNLSRTDKPNTIQFRFKANNINFYGSGSLRK